MADRADRDYERAKAKILKYTDRWVPRFGLDWWTITSSFYREGLPKDSATGRAPLAETSADWQYLQAQINWNMLHALDTPDDEIEATVMHELLHLVTAEISVDSDAAGRHGNVERVVSHLTKAFSRMAKD